MQAKPSTDWVKKNERLERPGLTYVKTKYNWFKNKQITKYNKN